jgi:hypothetical protein
MKIVNKILSISLSLLYVCGVCAGMIAWANVAGFDLGVEKFAALYRDRPAAVVRKGSAFRSRASLFVVKADSPCTRRIFARNRNGLTRKAESFPHS